MAELFMTAQGKKEKEERLNYLKNNELPEVLEKIKIAREFGDLSENSEYDAAKKEQTILMNEIETIEEMLRKATIVEDADVSNDVVSIGNFVKVYDMEFEEEETYKVVGNIESDPRKKYVSNESPMGMALLGAKVGDIITVKAPAGDIQMKILEIN
ncbi:MAG: transcription elongation factor GreA [Clostridia bacterium]|nr:transcription elongation factor GreA [Clostridia bacterium]